MPRRVNRKRLENSELNDGVENFIASLNVLPDVVILKIMHYLPRKDVLRCSELNHRFQQLSLHGSLWREINLSDKRIQENVVHRIMKGAWLLHLAGAKMKCQRNSLTGFNEVDEALDVPCTLRCLTVSYALPPDAIYRVLSRCQLLERLSVYRCHLTVEMCDCIRRNANLKSLDLNDCRVSDTGVKCILQGCTELEELNLGLPYSKQGNTTATKLACTLLPPTLLKLEICGSYCLRLEDIENITKRCKLLVELSIWDHCDKLPQAALEIILKLPGLKILHCFRWKEIGLTNYATLCRKLEQLHFYETPCLDMSFLSHHLKNIVTVKERKREMQERSPVADPASWHPLFKPKINKPVVKK